MRKRRVVLGVLAAFAGASQHASAATTVIRDGAARFEILTPTLVRFEYAADGHFEDRPTQTVLRRRLPAVHVVTRVARGQRTIRTSAMTLRYRRASGPIGADNLHLSLKIDGRTTVVRPHPGASPQNLGGWRRALDLSSGPVPLHDGILSRAGWYLSDDTATALMTPGSPGFAVRPQREGAYQDAYIFGYGHDYVRGLLDLRTLTGAAPLLPRSAFGVWFSRYWPYSENDYHALLGQFRAEKWPLDTLSVDTDFKRPSNPAGALVAGAIAGAPGKPFGWNGWEFNPDVLPDPHRFFDWAHGEGLSVALNIHPSISSSDPQWPATQQATGGLQTSPGMCQILQADVAQCGVFDWAKPRQLDAYLALHKTFEDAGADFFWLDWCCDASRADAAGLTPDTWINSHYAARERGRGQRWLNFSRAGGGYLEGAPNDNDGTAIGDGILAEHRSTIQFTGDTCATWQMLAFEARYTASEGNVGLPYVSHDIGSFNGVPYNGQCGPTGTATLTAHLPEDLYARWVQFGTFQPLDRLHSNHGDRLPSEYHGAAREAATAALRLREALNPYIYSLARRAHDTGLPMAGSLALQWPQLDAAYGHPGEFTFGRDVVVAPVISPGDPAPATVWIPPGTWVDYFTGTRYTGASEQHLSVPLSRMPVFVRAGAVIPAQGEVTHTAPGPPAETILSVFRGKRGGTTLYDDAGTGFGYEHAQFSRTRVTQRESRRGTSLRIGRAVGHYAGAPSRRAWLAVFRDVPKPAEVRLDGARLRQAGTPGWAYDASSRTLTVDAGSIFTRAAATVTFRR